MATMRPRSIANAPPIELDELVERPIPAVRAANARRMQQADDAADDAAVADRAADRAGRFSVWIYFLWLSTAVFEGPLRGGLSLVGLSNVIYARDLILALGVVLALIKPFTRGTSPIPGLMLMSWLMAIHLCVGIISGGQLFRAFFGLKIFLPLLFAVAISPAINRHFGLFVKAMALFFVASTAGVFVNYCIDVMPWEGMISDTAFGTVSITRVWWMGEGLRRLPGLARTSVDAAMFIGVSGTILMAAAKSRWIRIVIAALAIWTITLSTSKGMILAFFVGSLWSVFASRSVRGIKSGRAIVLALLLLTVAVPAAFMVISVREHPLEELPSLLESMWDRFSWMWPNGYASVPNIYGGLTGAGLGGIGSPLGVTPVENVGDSIFVYGYVSFGLVTLLYLAFPILAIPRPGEAFDRRDFAWIGILIIAFGYGATTNMVESGFFTSVFGFVYAKAFSRSRARRQKAGSEHQLS